MRFSEILDELEKKIQEADDHLYKCRSGDFSNLLTSYYNINEYYKQLDEMRKRMYGVVDRYNKSVIPAIMDERDLDKVQVASIARSFYPISKMTATIVDKQKGPQWLRDNGGEDLIQETVNASSLSAFVKEMMQNTGKEPPTEIIRVNTYSVTGISKYTPKTR